MKPSIHEDVLESIDYLLRVVKEIEWKRGRANRFREDDDYACLGDCIIHFDFYKRPELKHKKDCRFKKAIDILEFFTRVESELQILDT